MASHVGGYPQPSYSGGKLNTPSPTPAGNAGSSRSGGDTTSPGDQYTANYSLDSVSPEATQPSAPELDPDKPFDNFVLQAREKETDGEDTPAETTDPTPVPPAPKGNDSPAPPNDFKPRKPIPTWEFGPGPQIDPSRIDPARQEQPHPNNRVPYMQNAPLVNPAPVPPAPRALPPAPAPQAPPAPVAQIPAVPVTPKVPVTPQVPVQQQVPPQPAPAPIAPQVPVQQPAPAPVAPQVPVQQQVPPQPAPAPVTNPAPVVNVPQPQDPVQGLVPSHVMDSLISPETVQALGNPFLGGSGTLGGIGMPQQPTQVSGGSSGGQNWTQDLYGGILDNYFGGQQPSSDGIRDTAGLQFTSGF